MKDFICNVFTQYKDQLYANALLLTENHHDAEDVTIDVLINAIKSYSFGKNDKILKSWLFRAKCSICIDKLRRKSNYMQKIDILKNYEKANTNYQLPEQLLENKDFSDTFWKCFYNLNKDNQKMLLLYAYEGFSYAKIANMYKIPKGTVKSRMYNARKKLKLSIENMEKGS